MQILRVKGAVSTVARLQDEKEEHMTLPADFQEYIDWVDQPPPTNARDTHALHFRLESPEGIRFQGLMFYRPGGHPASTITQDQNGIEGKGYLIPDAPVCQRFVLAQTSPGAPPIPGPWIRVKVTWRTTTSGTSRIFADLLFKARDSFRNGLPGGTTSAVEFERVEADIGGGHVLMFEGQDPPGWQLDLTQTTVSL